MTHLAITEDPGSQPATHWGTKVTDEELHGVQPAGDAARWCWRESHCE
jgi:hypothetical protein